MRIDIGWYEYQRYFYDIPDITALLVSPFEPKYNCIYMPRWCLKFADRHDPEIACNNFLTIFESYLPQNIQKNLDVRARLDLELD